MVNRMTQVPTLQFVALNTYDQLKEHLYFFSYIGTVQINCSAHYIVDHYNSESSIR